MVVFFVVWRFMKVIEFIRIDWSRISANNSRADWSRCFRDTNERLDKDAGLIIIYIIEGVSFYLHSNE